MGIFGKLLFWRKKKLPDLPPEENSALPPLPEEKPFRLPEPEMPKFEEQQLAPSNTDNQFQVVSSKLDVLNAKIEVLNEKISNLEKNLQETKPRW